MLFFFIPLFGLLAAIFWLWGFGPFRVVNAAESVALEPPLLAARESQAEWIARRPEILSALDAHVYGPSPAELIPVVTKTAVAPADAGGIEGAEQWRVELGAAGALHLALVIPPNARPPAPVILLQNFSGNRAAFPGRPKAIAAPLQYYPWICTAPFDPLLRLFFGEHVSAPPFDLIASRGYALAMAYGGDVVPDHPRHARRAQRQFAPADTGALSVWAWVHSRALDLLLLDERLDPKRIAVWGQSRQGKVSLLAGARDERFAAVIALQAGRGGDAPTQHRSGESVRAILMQFPHWFTRRYRDYVTADPPVDQHQLIAGVAPRPLLIGHARRDSWADPVGGRSAVAAAAPVWDVFGAERPHVFMRDGRHGIVREDWEETLDFLEARMRAPR